MNKHMTFDAQTALGFVVSQTSHIETEVNETVYPDIQYAELIPVDTSAHPFATTVTYYSSDKFGKAGWINGNSNDIPLAGTERAKHETGVHMAGIGYSYGYEEINQAQMLGVNLQADDAVAARRAYEEMVDGVALSGDEAKGFQGLISHASVIAAAAGTGGWATASPENILGDVNALLEGVGAGTAYTSLADTLLLPKSVSQHLAKPMPGTTMPVLEYIMKYNTYTIQTGRPLTIRFIRGLDTAGAGSTKRMVAYRRDPQVLKLHIPMPHRFLPVFQDGPLSFTVPGVFRLGGLDIRRPKEVRYADGL
jgi:hypothetical protein